MKLSDFLSLLKTYPPNDEFRLYCPVNQKYYYISETNLHYDGTIILTDNKNKAIRSLTTYRSVIYNLNFPHIQNKEIQFYHKDQEFKIHETTRPH